MRPTMTPIMTEAEIAAKRTARRGWTRATLAAWGVPWPPPKGWKRALIEGRSVPTKGEAAQKPTPAARARAW